MICFICINYIYYKNYTIIESQKKYPPIITLPIYEESI